MLVHHFCSPGFMHVVTYNTFVVHIAVYLCVFLDVLCRSITLTFYCFHSVEMFLAVHLEDVVDLYEVDFILCLKVLYTLVCGLKFT